MKKIWKILGIKTSCERELYLTTRGDNDSTLKSHYKINCKILPDIKNESQRNTRSENLISKLQLSGELKNQNQLGNSLMQLFSCSVMIENT
jgi:hypothetical protein